jgi:glutamine synthetase
MVDALEAFGIRVEAAHHEVAVGQHEIDFEYSDALRTADNAVTFKFALKAIAQQHGLYATFMPKPIHGINGSGMHTHQSLFSIAEQRNAFADVGEQVRAVRPRPLVHGRHPAHARSMIAILAPDRELVQAARAGLRGADLPHLGPDEPLGADPGADGLAGQVDRGNPGEVRCPDPSSNTYLAFAAMIAAGLDGVEKGLTKLAEPVEESPVRDGRRADRRARDQGAAGHARRGPRRAQGGPGHPRRARRARAEPLRRRQAAEWDEYRTQVTQWELDRYLEAF